MRGGSGNFFTRGEELAVDLGTNGEETWDLFAASVVVRGFVQVRGSSFGREGLT